MTNSLLARGLAETGSSIAERSVSPVDLVEACLERINLLDGQIKAFVDVFPDEAMTAAIAAEREIAAGRYWGPLHGIPIAIKDLIHVAGVPTRAGSVVLANATPEPVDAPVVARLKAAGAIILGKTTTHEFAFNVFTPPTRNPWNLDHVSGGSSGGSGAAVAAEMVFAAIGTDTGGSIRIPAACCGVVGLKPTYGRVPKSGVVPLSWSLDHVGPLTRRVEDAAVFLQAVAGVEKNDPTTAAAPVPNFWESAGQGVIGLRLGIPDRYFNRRLQPMVAAIVEAAIEQLVGQGAVIVPVAMPTLDYAMDVHLLTTLAEAAAYHRARFPGAESDYGADVRASLALGDRISARDYLQAQRMRQAAFAEALAAFTIADVLITPTLPTEAPKVGQETISYLDGDEDALTSLIRFTCPFNQTGLPAVTVPTEAGANSLPVGIQIVGPPFEQGRVLHVAAMYEALHGARNHRPPMVRNF